MSRNIDMTEESEFSDARNGAANTYVKSVGAYANSYQAFAYKQVFGVGADTADAILLDDDLLLALIAGRRWAMQERESSVPDETYIELNGPAKGDRFAGPAGKGL